jgi:hypothetical protein
MRKRDPRVDACIARSADFASRLAWHAGGGDDKVHGQHSGKSP